MTQGALFYPGELLPYLPLLNETLLAPFLPVLITLRAHL